VAEAAGAEASGQGQAAGAEAPLASAASNQDKIVSWLNLASTAGDCMARNSCLSMDWL